MESCTKSPLTCFVNGFEALATRFIAGPNADVQAFAQADKRPIVDMLVDLKRPKSPTAQIHIDIRVLAELKVQKLQPHFFVLWRLQRKRAVQVVQQEVRIVWTLHDAFARRQRLVRTPRHIYRVPRGRESYRRYRVVAVKVQNRLVCRRDEVELGHVGVMVATPSNVRRKRRHVRVRLQTGRCLAAE